MTPAKKAAATTRSPSVEKSVWYKTVLYPAKGGARFSLQSAIETALNRTHADWVRRRQEISRDEVLVLNEYKAVKNGGIAARLMLFTKDVAVETGKLTPGNTVVHTSFIEAEAGEEVCSGTCIFLVRGNHVVMVTSRAIKWVVLANFLNWWLKELGIIDFRFSLTDGLSTDVRKKLHNVRRVEIFSGLSESADPDAVRPGPARRFLQRVSKEFVRFGVTPGAGVSVGDLIAARPLRARLVLELEGTRSDDAMMRELALSLQGHEDVRYVVSYGERGRLTNEEMTVTETLSLPSHKGHPQFIATVPQLLAWLDELTQAGRIAVSED